ncbi:MAG: hypothetical protein WC360_03340 [Opitutales bacterium]|jgi:hypothetical protein
MNSARVIRMLRQYPLVVASVLVSALLVVALVLRNDSLAALDAQMQQAQDRRESINRNSRYSITLADDLARLDEYQRRIDTALVEPQNKASNLAYFYELGSLCNVAVKRVEQKEPPQPVGDKKNFKPEFKSFAPIIFDIGVDGSFADIVRFLGKLKQDRFLVRIDKLNIKQGDILAGRVESADIVITALCALPAKEK